MHEWFLENSFDAGVLPASASVESSCEPPLRLTNLPDGVTPRGKLTRSVRRTSGFVLVGNPETWPRLLLAHGHFSAFPTTRYSSTDFPCSIIALRNHGSHHR